MNIAQVEENLIQLVKSFKREDFIFELLLAYGQPKASITRLSKGGLNLSKNKGEIIWKKKLVFKEVLDGDLHEAIYNLKDDKKIGKYAARFIIVTDFETLLAIDTKTNDTLDIPIFEITKYYDFFLPWAGMEKHQGTKEQEADVKAAEKMAKLYDEIRNDNPTKSEKEVHNLNVFLSRLLFCFFAEDTNIFEKGLFTSSISSHTQEDGSDLNSYLDKLFDVLNTNKGKRGNVPAYLNVFPYVNGGLFRDKHTAPHFTKKSRHVLIQCATLNWSAINPDIFGSMIQAVVTPKHRGGMGIHYTSVPNIMKVIGPLFLDELFKEFDDGKNEPRRLIKLLDRVAKIKMFDPACGSGNFLIIAYKELRHLEIKILKQLQILQKAASGFAPKQIELIPKSQLNLATQFQIELFTRVQLSQFYGIELDDFAHEIALLSLWLAEHQMNTKFNESFQVNNSSLPLKSNGNIIHGNANRIPWEKVCPKKSDDEVYIFGNPPYLGYALQSIEQKEDMEIVFSNVEDYKKLDFIACWFYLGTMYIRNSNSKFAFVTTNSICQGEQVSILWPNLLRNNLEIDFAYQSFKWRNNAKAIAAVAVAIIGIRNTRDLIKRLYSLDKYNLVKNINPYLVSASNTFITGRNKPLSSLPLMIQGCSPNDNGNLLVSEHEKINLCNKYPQINRLFKSYLGAEEFMNSGKRYCIWVTDKDIKLAYTIPELNERFEKCKAFRLASKKEATRKKAIIPYEFDEKRYEEANSIVIPKTGSERREYIPIGFLTSGTVVSNATRVIYNVEPYLFALISSRLHIVWVKAVAGRLKTDMQYSITLCYNTFPFPSISEVQKKELEMHVYRILDERENHSERTLAQLYDPDKMPPGLREAHHENDLAVERCFRSKPFENDEIRLEYLFKLYEQMISDEKTRGTLFESENKLKKKKK